MKLPESVTTVTPVSKALAILLFAFLPFIGFYFGYQYARNNPISPETTSIATESAVPTQTLVGDDKDEHGCIVSAGYQWCEAKQKCLRSWEEPCVSESSDSDLIKAALVAKYDWDPQDIILTISKNDGQYATGGVREESAMGGGMWFAAKVDGDWQIVWDGNGVIMCENLTDYPDYPKSLIPECYDSTTNEMVKR